MTDPQRLRELTRLGRPVDVASEITALERRLSRRRRRGQLSAAVLVLVLAGAGWTLVHGRPNPPAVEIASRPAAGAPPPSLSGCPEGAPSMTGNGTTQRVAALAIAAALTAGCTDGPGGSDGTVGGDPPSEGGPWTDVAVMELTLTGDIEHSARLRSTTGAFLQTEDAQAARSAWALGIQAPPILRLEDPRTRVRLNWRPAGEGASSLSSVSLLLRVDDFVFAPQSGDCTFDMRSGGAFLVNGSIECSGLSGIRGGSDERPTIERLEAELTYHVPVCITPAPNITATSECEWIDP